MRNLLRYVGYGFLCAQIAMCANASRHPRKCRCAQCQREKNDRRTSARQLCELMGLRDGTLDDAQFVAFALQYDRDALTETQRQAVEELARRNPRLLNDLLQDIQA